MPAKKTTSQKKPAAKANEEQAAQDGLPGTGDQSDPSDQSNQSDLVEVRALRPLCESGDRHQPGDTFRTTAARAAALGNLIEPVA